jgi:hypothetical protein
MSNQENLPPNNDSLEQNNPQNQETQNHNNDNRPHNTDNQSHNTDNQSHNTDNQSHNTDNQSTPNDQQTNNSYKKETGLVLCCMDHKFINQTFEFLKKVPSSTFDYIILSGASLGYNTGNECWKNMFLDHVDLALQKNDINKIIVIDHDNCSAYKLHYADIRKDPDLEEEYHYINMLKFKKDIKKIYPDLTVFTHLLKIKNNL